MANIEISKTPAFAITDAEGNQSRQEIREFPFRIGRQSGNHLVIRDARASRHHARLTLANGDFVLEDLGSRHGVFVNSERIERKPLQDGDRIEFGVADSYILQFERPGSRVAEIAEHLVETDLAHASGAGGQLARLRAVLQVSRALQTSFSVDGVLAAVVDAALVITNAERGFLLLRQEGDLRLRAARDRNGNLRESELEVPRKLLLKALEEGASTLSLQFDPADAGPSASAHALELKSIVCIPLVKVQMSADPAAAPGRPGETVGLLYMDSRTGPRDMAAGNRELLETLGIEASMVLENARLLEEDRARRHLEEELAIARGIQHILLPSSLPETGWLRGAGYSSPSRQVGGDHYDLIRVGPDSWAAIVADVSGKGVSAALGAAILQGAFLGMDENPDSMRHTLKRLNDFLLERAESGKYVTVFCAVIDVHGAMRYINAGHCAPILVPINDQPETLPATSPPVGLLDNTVFEIASCDLQPFDRLVIYTDGITEARDASGEFFGIDRLNAVIRSHGDRPASLLHQAILEALEGFTGGQEQNDDQTLVVLEYRPD